MSDALLIQTVPGLIALLLAVAAFIRSKAGREGAVAAQQTALANTQQLFNQQFQSISSALQTSQQERIAEAVKQGQLQGRIDVLNSSLEDVRSRLEDERLKATLYRNTAEDQFQSMQKKMDAMSAEIEKLRAERDAMREEYERRLTEAIKEATAPLVDEIEKLRQTLESKNAIIAELENKIETMKKDKGEKEDDPV